MNAKEQAAEKAIALIQNGMTIGLGSGSTAQYAIEKIGARVRQGLRIKAVASSVKTGKLAAEWDIPIIPLSPGSSLDSIDLALDGADEVDTRGNLIKGGGGSLLREKIIAFGSKRFHVMVDDTKLVERLGRGPLPVEIIPFAAGLTLMHLRRLGCVPLLRTQKGKNFITDNGNLIADCKFDDIEEPASLDMKIKMIPGVIETGLFSARIVTSIFIGSENGNVREVSVSP